MYGVAHRRAHREHGGDTLETDAPITHTRILYLAPGGAWRGWVGRGGALGRESAEQCRAVQGRAEQPVPHSRVEAGGAATAPPSVRWTGRPTGQLARRMHAKRAYLHSAQQKRHISYPVSWQIRISQRIDTLLLHAQVDLTSDASRSFKEKDDRHLDGRDERSAPHWHTRPDETSPRSGANTLKVLT